MKKSTKIVIRAGSRLKQQKNGACFTKMGMIKKPNSRTITTRAVEYQRANSTSSKVQESGMRNIRGHADFHVFYLNFVWIFVCIKLPNSCIYPTKF